MYLDLECPERQSDTSCPGLLTASGADGIAVAMAPGVSSPVFAQQSQTWDKTFPSDPQVDHQKVSFRSRLGITLVADMYSPT